MNRGEESTSVPMLRATVLLLAAAALLMTLGCNKLAARDRLNKGVNAYRNARYEEAINRFQEAVQLDPNLMNAKLYLATAYAGQYVQGVDTPENNRFAEQAIDTYRKVLDSNPTKDQKVLALKGIASLYFNMKKFPDAKEYDRKVLEVDPKDTDTYYSIGVIDWTQSYATRMKERAAVGIQPTERLKDKKVCAKLKEENGQEIDEGIQMLNKALELRPDYDDAMAYMNLLYREKADTECMDPAQQEADLKTADGWVDKTLQTKKEKAEKHAGAGGITETPAR
jgi:tetratricopeptide (TPR) repeat protein